MAISTDPRQVVAEARLYAITPNLATVLGGGVTRATVTFTYP